MSCLLGAVSAQGQGFDRSVLSSDSVLSAWGIAAADLDGDGDMDIAASGRLGSLVWIERTDTAYVTHSILETGFEMRGVAAGDFNGDGREDIMAASYGDDRYLWLENTGENGAGRFQVHTLSAGHGAYSIRTGDVNGDGHMEVLTADYLGNTIRIFKSVGDTVATLMGVRVLSPLDAVFADLDGDGNWTWWCVPKRSHSPGLSMGEATQAGRCMNLTSARIAGTPRWPI
jgi:hypothetical protein